MTWPSDPVSLAAQARRLYVERLALGLPGLARRVDEAAPRSPGAAAAAALIRREQLQSYAAQAGAWVQAMGGALRRLLVSAGSPVSQPSDLPLRGDAKALSLVDNLTIEREILSSRLALVMADRAAGEFADLRSRMALLGGRQELDAQDMLHAHVLARLALEAWTEAGLGLEAWRELQPLLHAEFACLLEEAYHELNRMLAANQVLPEVDLRPLIRRTPDQLGAAAAELPLPSRVGGLAQPGAPLERFGSGGSGVQTYQDTQSLPHHGGRGSRAQALLSRFGNLVERQIPGFLAPLPGGGTRQPSPALQQAMAQPGTPSVADDAVATVPALLEELAQRKRTLKAAAQTPVERATIEIVALLFQSILTEERLPASVRVWFARLQMPVLRVAVGEPDFFATANHPARRLIDRMGSCVMGFDTSASPVDDALETEIKRIVQVVEAYPDTGRRVFQTVLGEFEQFLQRYFAQENEATRKGVSLAQQVEQRETLAIQYTIELRKMLGGMPVQDGVRQFLFQIWADVLATMAVKSGQQGEATRTMKRAAADLIWSASAKVSREERAEVIRRLPPLLRTLREGMAAAGLSAERQEQQVSGLNNALAAAFTARAAAIPAQRLEELTERLETLEELLPESAAEVPIDESVVLDLSGYESSELEVVGEGGATPAPAMLAWARELQVGSWFMLDFRGRNEPVQLAWQGLRHRLSLFVTPGGRCVLFQQQRLAAFLQAGLLLPAQDEALTVRATRTALEKIDVDPTRLLG